MFSVPSHGYIPSPPAPVYYPHEQAAPVAAGPRIDEEQSAVDVTIHTRPNRGESLDD